MERNEFYQPVQYEATLADEADARAMRPRWCCQPWVTGWTKPERNT